MSEIVHENAISAWHYLVENGGIELDERDEGLDKQIHQLLNPTVPSLEDALESATIDEFAKAFFEAVHPYIAMFRDILDFFVKAGASTGPDQWTLKLNEINLDLEHFRRLVSEWTEMADFEVEIPAVDWAGIWEICRVLKSKEDITNAVQQSFKTEPAGLAIDVRAWVNAYNRGEFPPLPNTMLSPEFPEELQTCVLIANAVQLRLGELQLNRESLMHLYRNQRGELDRSDALDFWSIAQNETDFCLRTFVVALASANANLTPDEMKTLGNDLKLITDKFPTKPINLRVSVASLSNLVSLPIWKQRYELFAVWIATEMIRALNDHQIEIHHDNGKIEFAFRETIIASIRSASPAFTLVSERRTPLVDPQGEGRKHSVQPDHGLWATVDDGDVCRLVVEVKHYKQSAKKKFVDVFEDYARAFPEATVYLVNHGPIGNAVYDVSRSVRDRCHAIGRLTPSSIEARDKLADAVRTCVGEPVIRQTRNDRNTDSNAIAFDVSASMKRHLTSRKIEKLVDELVAEYGASRFVSIDSKIVGSWEVSNAGLAKCLACGGGQTDLEPSLNELLKEFESVIVVSDEEGTSKMEGINSENLHLLEPAPIGVVIRRVSRRPPRL